LPAEHVVGAAVPFAQKLPAGQGAAAAVKASPASTPLESE